MRNPAFSVPELSISGCGTDGAPKVEASKWSKVERKQHPQSTQIGKATNTVFWDPLNHIILFYTRAFEEALKVQSENMWINMRLMVK